MPMRSPVAGLALVVAAGLLLAGCSSGRPEADNRVYRMGEPVTVGPLIYTVTETEWHNQLGEGPTARLPQYRFLLVRLSVTNSGASNSAIPAMALVDASGQTRLELADGEGVPEWLGYLRTISPAQTERGRVVFDAPPNAYRLRVTDDAEPGAEKAALIDVPLQLSPLVPAGR
jgi:hypothetical protein